MKCESVFAKLLPKICMIERKEAHEIVCFGFLDRLITFVDKQLMNFLKPRRQSHFALSCQHVFNQVIHTSARSFAFTPDLAPSEFYLFSNIKSAVQGTSSQDVKNVYEKVTHIITMFWTMANRFSGSALYFIITSSIFSLFQLVLKLTWRWQHYRQKLKESVCYLRKFRLFYFIFILIFFFVNIFAHHQLNFSQLNLIVILVATFRVRKIGKPIPKNCVHEDLKHQKGKKWIHEIRKDMTKYIWIPWTKNSQNNLSNKIMLGRFRNSNKSV